MSCTPTHVRISDITNNQTQSTSFNTSPWSPGITTTVSGGVAKRWLTPGPTPSGWHSPGPSCSFFVEIDGVKRASTTNEDPSTSYDPTNGGGSYSGGTRNDFTFNSWDPALVANYGTSCTSASDPTCYGRIHVEMDHDWQAAGYCGTGTACDPSTFSSQTTDGVTLIDFQGFVYWDPANLGAADHSFSGWELHPLTAWRIHQATPTPSFTFSPSSPTAGQAVTFTGSVSGGTGPYTFSWIFGDGATTTGNPVTHTYSASGTYTVQLTVTDSLGASGTSSQSVTVGGSGTVPDFSISSSPTSLTIQSGSTTTSTINLASLNSFSGSVSLSSSVSPSGLTATLNPTSVSLSAGGSATSTLTVSSSTIGSHTVTITGTSGSLSHSTIVTVTVTAPTSVVVASDSAVGPSSIATEGGQKLIQDSVGKMIAVYVDSSGRIGLSYANSDPNSGGWSTPIKSATPTSPYMWPAAVLVSLTSLRILAGGGSASGAICDIPVTITRDSQNNITGFSFGTPTILDSSGLALYPAAVLAHNGDILLAWGYANSTRSEVKSLRWDPSTGWTNFGGSSKIPDVVLVDSSNLSYLAPNIIERPDNNNVYLFANRFPGPPSTIAFNKATWNGSIWSWGTQNLTYESNASDADDDLASVAWDPVKSLVVVAYGITGTFTYGVFTLTSSDVKTHMDTPSLAVTGDRGWGSIGVHTTTGDYYLFLISVDSDAGSGPLGYIRMPSGGTWNATITWLDTATNNQVTSLRPTGTSPTLDLLYAQGTSSPVTVRFTSLRPFNPPNFSVSTSPTSLTTQASSSGTVSVTVTSLYNFVGTVSLSATVSPSGLTASLTPSSVTLTSGGTGSSTLTVSSLTVGNYTVTILATSGSLSHSTKVTVAVTDFTVAATPTSASVNTGTAATSTITITPVNHFTGTIALTSLISPTGLTCTLTPSSIVLGVSQTSTLSCTGPSGVYTVTVTGASASLVHTATLTVTVKDFSVTASPTSISALAGATANSTIALAPANGFTGTVALTLLISPSTGLTCTLSPTSIVLGASQTSKLSCSGSPGVYSVTVTGSSSGITHSTSVTVTTQDFTLTDSPTSVTANAGASATSTITVAPVNGFTGTVALSSSISPSSGLTCTLTPTSIVLGASQTSNLSCKGSAGVYNVTVTGKSGGLVHSATLTVTMMDFTVTANPTSIVGPSGGASTITVAPVNGFTGTVTLTLSVSPTTGMSCSLNPTSITLGSSQTSTLSCSGSTGTFTITITGTSGSLSHSATVTVAVADFTVTASPTSISANAGATATSTITVAPVNGFTGTVSLTSPVSPSGLSCTLTPSSIVLGSSQTSTLSCTGPGGVYTVTVTGNSGTLTHSVAVTVTMKDFAVSASPSTVTFPTGSSGASTITLASLNGFSGTLTLTSSVNPSTGLSVTCSPTSAVLTSGGSATSNCSFNSSNTGTYTVTVTASNGTLTHSTMITVNVSEFSITASPSSQTALATIQGNSTIILNSLNSFSGTVTLTLSSPAGITASLSQTSLLLSSGGTASSVLIFNSAAMGNYTFTVTATSGSLTHSVLVAVRVVDFSVSGSPSLTIFPGQTGTATITLNSLGGFTGSIALATAASPSGLTASLSPTSVSLVSNGSGSSSLTISSSTAGVYTLTVTGTSGGASHSVQIKVNVEDYSVSASPSTVGFQSGSNGTSTVTLISLGGFAGNVALSETANPSTGLSASCTPSSVSLTSGGSATSTCTFSSSTQGTYTVTITSISGPLSHTTMITVGVGDFTISSSPSSTVVQSGSSSATTINLNSIAGFTGMINLSTSVSPRGLTASVSPTSVSLSPGGTASSTLTLSSGTVGTYNVTITGTIGSLSHSVHVIVKVVDFTISSGSTSLTIQSGASGTSSIQLGSVNGFAGTVTLATSVLPSGLTASPSPSMVTLSSSGSGSSTLTVTSSVAGNYTVTVTATSGSLTHSIQVTVQVVDFKISASPGSLSDRAGTSSNSTISLTSINGLTGSLSLTTTVSPSGPLSSLNPTTVALSAGGSGTSTLTISSPSNTTPGTYTVTVTATIGTLSHSITVTLNVPDYSITASPATVNFTFGSTGTSTINLASLGGFTGTVALTASSSSNALNASLSSPNVALSAGGTGTSTLTLTASTGGTYTVTVTGTSSSFTHSVTITISVQDFGLSTDVSSLTLAAGSSGNFTINLASINGFTGSVSLSAVCSSTSPRLSLSSTSVSLISGGTGTSDLRVRTFHKTLPGTYTITITGTSGGITHTVTVTLIVT